MRRVGAIPAYYLIQSAASVSFAIVYTLNIYYQTALVGMTAFELVIVGTTLEVIGFFSEVPTGIVADVYSRRLSILIGYLLLGITFVLEGVFPVFMLILLIQIPRALGYTFISGALQAWIVDELGTTRQGDERTLGRVFLRGAQIGQIGGIAGVVMGIGLGLIHVQVAIVIGGVIMIALSLALALLMPETGFRPVPAAERQTFRQMMDTFRAGVRSLRGSRVLVLAALIVLVSGLYSEGLDRLWPKHLIDNADMRSLAIPDVILVGGIAIAQQIGALLVTEIVRRRVNTRSPRALVTAQLSLSALQAAALFGFALAGQFWIAALLLVTVSALRAAFHPLFDAWINPHLTSSARATTLSMLAQTDAIGQIAGGPTVAAVGGIGGVRAALGASALLLLPIVPLLGRARVEESRRLDAAQGTPTAFL